MDEEYKVKYLRHPVDMKEVRKWRAKGFDVIDAKFDPNPKAFTEPPVLTTDDKPALL